MKRHTIMTSWSTIILVAFCLITLASSTALAQSPPPDDPPPDPEDPPPTIVITLDQPLDGSKATGLIGSSQPTPDSRLEVPSQLQALTAAVNRQATIYSRTIDRHPAI